MMRGDSAVSSGGAAAAGGPGTTTAASSSVLVSRGSGGTEEKSDAATSAAASARRVRAALVCGASTCSARRTERDGSARCGVHASSCASARSTGMSSSAAVSRGASAHAGFGVGTAGDTEWVAPSSCASRCQGDCCSTTSDAKRRGSAADLARRVGRSASVACRRGGSSSVATSGGTDGQACRLVKWASTRPSTTLLVCPARSARRDACDGRVRLPSSASDSVADEAASYATSTSTGGGRTTLAAGGDAACHATGRGCRAADSARRLSATEDFTRRCHVRNSSNLMAVRCDSSTACANLAASTA
ncbi:hypothetical protein NESM_000645400 [Novymonas esmeraldas]|uniref:Uncharacterized protein n=1 Tax=Novymonas esmeraldas TaxID=1808958 RepID=A0AAW0EU04_9TRYP